MPGMSVLTYLLSSTALSIVDATWLSMNMIDCRLLATNTNRWSVSSTNSIKMFQKEFLKNFRISDRKSLPFIACQIILSIVMKKRTVFLIVQQPGHHTARHDLEAN